MKSAVLGICLTLLIVVVCSNALRIRPPSSTYCRRPICKTDCPNGQQRNPRGCLTCRCKLGIIRPPKPVCGPLCRMYCPNGNVKDSNGCPICKCKPRRCPRIKCARRCPFGRYVRNSKGCRTCRCRGRFSSRN
ncbi:hypothetical protein SNE40_017099 [Patella caerulea]|uniref:Antistasin-like domain-containing protein n=1 Tax=Patella caerulea TaxID=87958 RepID=A0AAN8JAG3_PATCE